MGNFDFWNEFWKSLQLSFSAADRGPDQCGLAYYWHGVGTL